MPTLSRSINSILRIVLCNASFSSCSASTFSSAAPRRTLTSADIAATATESRRPLNAPAAAAEAAVAAASAAAAAAIMAAAVASTFTVCSSFSFISWDNLRASATFAACSAASASALAVASATAAVTAASVAAAAAAASAAAFLRCAFS